MVYAHGRNLFGPVHAGQDPDRLYPTFVFRMLMSAPAPGQPTPRDELLGEWQRIVDAAIPAKRRALAREILQGAGGVYDEALIDVRERMYDAPLEREVAEKYASVVGKLMPGGDVLSWHANALAKVARGDIDGAVADLDRAIRGLSPIALPGRWSREFPGLLPTPAQLAATFGELVLAQDKPELARRALEKLPMPATDDAHTEQFAKVEEALRERCGIEPDVEISADRALVRANREHPLAVRLARTLAYFAIAPLPCTRLGDLAVALPYLIRLGFLHEMAHKLDALDGEVRAAVAGIPEARRKVISTHRAFGYFAAAYGITFIAPLGVSTESEPSARDVADIIIQIRRAKIPAIFLENISDPRLIRRIADETGVRVGGTLYSDSLTAEKGEAPTYIDMVRHNIKALTSALGQ